MAALFWRREAGAVIVALNDLISLYVEGSDEGETGTNATTFWHAALYNVKKAEIVSVLSLLDLSLSRSQTGDGNTERRA